MNTSRDSLLEAIVKIAEDLPPTDPHEVFHVTLMIGGMLVTGRIISHDEYIRHHVFVEKLWVIPARKARCRRTRGLPARGSGGAFILPTPGFPYLGRSPLR